MDGRTNPRISACAALLGALAATSCGGGGPEWVLLAEAYEPPATLAAEGRAGWRERFELGREAWRPAGRPGLFEADAPWTGLDLPLVLDDPERAPRLAAYGLDLAPDAELGTREDADPGALAGRHRVVQEPGGERVLLQLAPGDEPPEIVEVAVFVAAGERAPGGAWRVAAGALASDGFALVPGEPVELTARVAAGSALRFAASWVAESGAEIAVSWRSLRGGGEHGTAIFRGGGLATRRFEVDLASARGETTFVFEARGPVRWAAIHAPVIGPRAVGRPGRRPWSGERPGVVLFLADTFRADSLALHGADHGAAPRLDAFAETALRFPRAWAPSCWTLPSHASMFLALEPHRHGAVRHGLVPAAGLVSLAERLAEAGYRTAAITDSLYVSRAFDIDRGFEWFEERDERDLDATVARALELAAEDDGRPLFLFVHTYRTHEPYVASEETRRALGERLGLAEGDTWEGLQREIGEILATRTTDEAEAAAARLAYGDIAAALAALGIALHDPGPDGRSVAERLRALYLGGVADLDRGFGRFLSRLDASPVGASSYVLFTSDHGEALGEHDTLFHGRGVWEENLRVPLLVRGPDLAPRTSRLGASLVDLPRTICELARVAPARGWGGRSLVSAGEDAAVLAFDCAQNEAAPSAALVTPDGLKVSFPDDAEAIERGELLRAFHLPADPGERADLLPEEEGRARAALEAARPAIERARTPAGAPGSATVDPARAERLRAFGYAGE